MSCDTHQTALESRPAALPLPTVLRIADRGPPPSNCCHDNFIPRPQPGSPNSPTFYYLADKQMELSKTLYNRRAKIKESEEIRMETRRNTRGEYLEDYLRVLYIYRIHIKTKTNDLFKKGKNKIKIQFSFERDTRTFHSKCLQRYNKQVTSPQPAIPSVDPLTRFRLTARTITPRAINDLGKVTSDIDSGIGETNGAGAGT